MTTLGGRARIIVPVTARDAAGIEEELAALRDHPHDMVEWRVDRFMSGTAEGIAAAHGLVNWIMSQARVPVLTTVRTKDEGGAADLDADSYRAAVLALAEASDAVDVEIMRDLRGQTITEARMRGAVVVASFHDFAGTPTAARLRELLGAQAATEADVMKFACTPSGPKDLLRVLEAQVWAREEFGRPVIGIAMGELGTLSRLCGQALGNAATFATGGASSAPGQLTAEQVREVLDLVQG